MTENFFIRHLRLFERISFVKSYSLKNIEPIGYEFGLLIMYEKLSRKLMEKFYLEKNLLIDGQSHCNFY